MRSKSENEKTAGAARENGPRRLKVSQEEKTKKDPEQQAPAGGAASAATWANEVC